MDDSAIEIAKLIGTVIVTIILGLGGNRLLNRSAGRSETSVEDQLNIRIGEKDRQIESLNARVDELENDLERERTSRAEDQRRYQNQLDDLRERFENFRNSH